MEMAIFLDRDGIINYPVLNPRKNEYEAPANKDDLKLVPEAIEALKELQELDYKLFLVSNQPDYAKGKTTFENLQSVHNKIHSILSENNIIFTEYYYCYHHPNGIVPEYSIPCECRKPGNFFLKQAKLKYGLDLLSSWMIGDSDVDIFCGQSAGTRTIMVKIKRSAHRIGQSNPDFLVNNLREAVEIVKKEHQYAKH